MPNLGMRPRFALDVACPSGTFVKELASRAAAARPELDGDFDERHCVLRIAEARRTFWSPELDLTFEASGAAAAPVRIRGMFAPRPGVWTGFAFVYSVLFVAALAGALFGLAELSLGGSSDGFAVTGGALTLLVLVYAASFAGQALASGQMVELRRVVDESVREAESAVPTGASGHPAPH